MERTTFISRLAAAILSLALLPRPAAAEVRWNMDLPRASIEARAADRPLLLEFWADWCAPCKVMDEQVFADSRVADAIRKVVPVRIDIDRDPQLARKYQVEGTPTLVLTDSYGRELFRYQGLLGADAVLGLLAEVPAEIATINRLGEAVARNGNDFGALASLGLALREARLYRASTTYLERALRTRAARDVAAARRVDVLTAIAENHKAVQDHESAARALERAETIRRDIGRRR